MLSGSETQRTRDLRTVLDLVRTGKATTRGEIIEHLNLRSTTVSELVGELVEADLLRESVVRQRGRGRPAAYLSYNTQRFGVIFMQVASRSIVAKAVDMAGRVVAEAHAAPPADTANDEMAAVLLSLAAEALERFPTGVEVIAVVCSFSGLLDAPRKLWCFSSRWPNVSNLDVGEVLRGLGKEVVLVRNLDAELAGRLADTEKRREESVLLLHWGYGIGAAYYTEGAIVNRLRGRFCEIGHWGLGNARGARCTCGNTDCLETVAALWSLGPQIRSVFPDLPLDEDAFGPMAERLNLLDVPALAEATREVVRLTGNLSRLLFPDRIILTGPFVRNADIFHRFVVALEAAPVLRSLDRTIVTSGEQGSRHELSGAVETVFEAACDDLLRRRG
ncbi:ROK family transcriptional regulator [Aurantimonas sp. VKM B-3413]|uniref:ROK family transcriptional regulator n=1 Tax=Aurantimonas sp. VKM B-3413 TaxID=2779401 RepID=UPI001E2A3AF5|nr:ROK family transcriptional regulator [Aurantimonas sp. VKM B-3413]MCB8838025.1 ROK family protein [Aurantimonas sp. VKM B-3413]